MMSVKQKVFGGLYSESYRKYYIHSTAVPINIRQMVLNPDDIPDWRNIFQNALLMASELGRELYVDGGVYPILTPTPIDIPSGTRLMMHPEAQLQRGWDSRTVAGGDWSKYLLRTQYYNYPEDGGSSNIMIVGGQITNDSIENEGGGILLVGDNIIVEGLLIDGWAGKLGMAVVGHNHLYNHVTIQNPRMKVDAVRFNGVDALHIFGGNGINIRNCHIHGGDDAIGLFQAVSGATNYGMDITNVTIEGCFLRSEIARMVGMGLFRATPTGALRNVTIRDCHGEVEADYRMISIANVARDKTLISNINISGVHAIHTGDTLCHGVVIANSEKVTVRDCVFENVTWHCVLLDGRVSSLDDVMISNNKFLCAGTGTSELVQIGTGDVRTYNRITIENNFFQMRDTQNGIAIKASSVVNGLTIRGNVFKGLGSTNEAIDILGAALSPLIANNTITKAVGASSTTGIRLGSADITDALLWQNDLSGVDTPVNNSAGVRTMVASRKPGWTAGSGTATRTTFDTATVTTELLAQRVKALLDDLLSYGILGA